MIDDNDEHDVEGGYVDDDAARRRRRLSDPAAAVVNGVGTVGGDQGLDSFVQIQDVILQDRKKWLIRTSC